MKIVDIRINESIVKYSVHAFASEAENFRFSREHKFFIVHLPFANAKDQIVENKRIVFASLDKAGVIEFINFLLKANAYVKKNSCEPEEVKGYEKWCDYSNPGLDGWPYDKEFLKLTDIVVKYHDYLDNSYDVDLFTN